MSELTRREPDAGVIAWLDRQPFLSIWTSSISIFETRYGLQVMAAGKQRERVAASFENFFAQMIENRILAFDADAALEAATLMAARKRLGFPVDLRDMMIAGIALSARATLATRNTKHFHDLKVPVVNPWHEGAKLL